MYWYVPVHTHQYHVMDGMYQYVLVHTEQCHVISSIYWYVPVRTSMYQYILNYEYVSIVHTGTYLYILVRPRTVGFVRDKKNCIKVSNQRSSAYFEQNLPLSYGGTDLDAGMLTKRLSLYIYIVAFTRLVCAPGA